MEQQWNKWLRRNYIFKMIRFLVIRIFNIEKYGSQNFAKTKHRVSTVGHRITYQLKELFFEIVKTVLFSKEVGRNSQTLLAMKVYYVPLYFSIYFTVYIGYLILKAISRHRIKIPSSSSDAFLLFAR